MLSNGKTEQCSFFGRGLREGGIFEKEVSVRFTSSHTVSKRGSLSTKQAYSSHNAMQPLTKGSELRRVR